MNDQIAAEAWDKANEAYVECAKEQRSGRNEAIAIIQSAIEKALEPCERGLCKGAALMATAAKKSRAAAIEKVRTETLAECRAATEQQICDLQDRAHASEPFRFDIRWTPHGNEIVGNPNGKYIEAQPAQASDGGVCSECGTAWPRHKGLCSGEHKPAHASEQEKGNK